MKTILSFLTLVISALFFTSCGIDIVGGPGQYRGYAPQPGRPTYMQPQFVPGAVNNPNAFVTNRFIPNPDGPPTQEIISYPFNPTRYGNGIQANGQILHMGGYNPNIRYGLE